MTPLIVAGFVTCLLFGSVACSATSTQSSSLGFKSVNVGQNVILTCFLHNSNGVIFYWFKQTQGQKPQLVSEFFKHKINGSLRGEMKNDARFDLDTSSGENHLKISNVQMSDSATYYCVSIYSYEYKYLEGIIVYVKDSGLNIQTLVHQSASESIQSGGSVTLNCSVQTGTCDGEHSVYWFKDSEESYPKIIYTHGDRNNQCERKPNTQTLSCLYNLPLKNLKASQAGTYYCAVASCGYILFGKRTKLDFEEAHSLVLLYVLSGSLAFSILLVVVLACTTYKLYKKKSCTCKGPQESSSTASDPNAEGNQDEDDLHYTALNKMKVSGSRRQRDTESHCVYSSVRQ